MLLIRLCLLLIFSFCVVEASEAESCRRIYAHLTIKDPAGALQEADLALRQYPGSLALAKARIEVLAAMGQEAPMLQAWQSLVERWPEERECRELLEIMAWGIIRKGVQASSPITVAASLLAAQKSQDARGVALLAAAMRNDNSLIRSLAVDLAGHMRDACLRDEVMRLLQEESVWSVRLGAIRAAGQMRIHESQGILEQILAAPSSAAEEKAAAIEAVVNIMDSGNSSKVRALAASNRAGLRLLACQVVAFCGESGDTKLLLPLLNDVNGEVRGIALQVMGVVRGKGQHAINLKEYAKKKVSDGDPFVAISAAWLLTLEDPEQGQLVLSKWLTHPRRETRLMATGALISTGRYGLPLMRSTFYTSLDPYVRLNTAIGLISQRSDVEEACSVIAETLQMAERWQWDQCGIFRMVSPSTERHKDSVPNFPEAINQMVRLELLNVLAMMKSPDAQESLRKFLKERNWGITGVAAALLLSEGNEDAADIVAALLDDPDTKVRMQAALALGVLGSDARATEVLQSSYELGDRTMKEKVLEAVGSIGRMTSVPFLVDKLSDPHQNLRLTAASALLQCLNH